MSLRKKQYYFKNDKKSVAWEKVTCVEKPHIFSTEFTITGSLNQSQKWDVLDLGTIKLNEINISLRLLSPVLFITYKHIKEMVDYIS